MKLLILAAFLAGMGFSQPDEFPMRVHIVHLHHGGFVGADSEHGEGFLNLEEPGQPTRGYQFAYSNCIQFNGNLNIALPAQWTDKTHFGLIMQRADLQRPKDTCLIRVVAENYRYVHRDGKLIGVPLQPTASQPAPQALPPAPDPPAPKP